MYMIAFVRISLKDGISKKILSQASALSKISKKCILLCLDENSIFQIIIFKGGELLCVKHGASVPVSQKLNRVDKFISLVDKEITSNYPIYIRHMVPSAHYINFLNKHKHNKIYYEIPTYPYYYEQMSSSSNKLFTFIRLCHETLFWPFIYRKIYRLVAIPCRSKLKKYKKMIFISNGYSNGLSNDYEINNNIDNDTLTLVGVGTIQRYHGYEKILYAMSKSDIKSKFIIVGGGDTNYLKCIVAKLNLNERVVFTGPKEGKELEEIYKEADIGVGTLCLEMRRADLDTGIKILDYYIHGIPVVSGGICPLVNVFDVDPFIIFNDEKVFYDIKELLDLYNISRRKKLSEYTLNYYSWNSIMERVIDE